MMLLISVVAAENRINKVHCIKRMLIQFSSWDKKQTIHFVHGFRYLKTINCNIPKDEQLLAKTCFSCAKRAWSARRRLKQCLQKVLKYKLQKKFAFRLLHVYCISS